MNILGRTVSFFLLMMVLLSCQTTTGSQEKDKLAPVTQMKMTILTSEEREVDVVLFYPKTGCEDCHLIVFSHGAYAAPDRYDVLLRAWAGQGYIIAAPLHVDSENYKNRAQFDQNSHLRLRVEDIERMLENLLTVPQKKGVAFSFSGDYVAAGHSFGAYVAQIIAGAHARKGAGVDFDNDGNNPIAVIAISPPPEIPGAIDTDGWSSIDAPMLVVTGTEDVLPGFVDDWRGHLDSYEAAPAHLAYAAIFDGMDHYFNGSFGRIDVQKASVSTSAITRLNAIILNFVDRSVNEVAPTSDQWMNQSDIDVTFKTRAIR